jgi:hypothetical protein
MWPMLQVRRANGQARRTSASPQIASASPIGLHFVKARRTVGLDGLLQLEVERQLGNDPRSLTGPTGDAERAPIASTRSLRPTIPDPRAASAPPTPSSRTDNNRLPSRSSSETSIRVVASE